MIVVDFQLWSAVTGNVSSCGLILIDNVWQSADGNRADYRVRAYAKGVGVMGAKGGAKPIREAMVKNHPKVSKPVWSLMHKALTALGYAQ